MSSAPRRVLVIVENLPVPFDTRVWNESTTLRDAGYQVSVISPMGQGARSWSEVIDGIHIYRHPLRSDARGAVAYVSEYLLASFWQFLLTWRVMFARGFDVIHACNPPDTVFVLGLMFRVFG